VSSGGVDCGDGDRGPHTHRPVPSGDLSAAAAIPCPGMTPLDLSGRVALVTGAARGIGLETARALHRRGAKVVLVDLDQAAAEQAAASISPEALGLAADVTDRAAIGSAVEGAVARFGGLDVVVANAGIANDPRTALTMDEDLFERVIQVNLLGVWRTVRAALPYVTERRGNVTVISSIYAFANPMGAMPYAVAKAGVEQLGRGLRTELSGRGVGATVAYFGFIDTEMVHAAFDRNPKGDLMREAIPAPLRKRLPPAAAGEGIAAAIEAGHATVMLPRRWRILSALRGANVLLDRATLRDKRVQQMIREIDA
jgi:NAD(P)-dependent dehydrogenase (short-subunit alcohol dehydrogenase family)